MHTIQIFLPDLTFLFLPWGLFMNNFGNSCFALKVVVGEWQPMNAYNSVSWIEGIV